MGTPSGHLVGIGERLIRIPAGWSISQQSQVTLCWNDSLKGRIVLFYGGERRLEDIPVEGLRTSFYGRVFMGHLEQGIIKPSVIQRVIFRRKPHYRFEWVIQHDRFCIFAVYLAELDEDRKDIETKIEKLLDALDVAAP